MALLLLAFASCVQCVTIGGVECRRALASVMAPVRLRTVVDPATTRLRLVSDRDCQPPR